MECMTEETFGPTLPIMKVADAEEAIRLANDSPYGLGASVFSKDMARAEAVALRAAVGVVLLVGAAIWLATAVWCVVAWGAFRQAFAVTRVRAWLATSLWIALLGAVFWLGRRLV
jgi:hypothetical protein